MPKTYCVEGVNLTCYLIGEPGSGTESLIPKEVTHIFQDYDEIKASLAPGQLFEDPYFDAVETSLAYNPKEKDNEIKNVETIEWLRPKEILKAKGIEGTPLFIDNGGDPDKVGDVDDVNQNVLLNCWFLCSMAELSKLPEVFWMVVCKENLTQFNEEEYRGIFKFRFLAFGRLIEVVVDDRIPYLRSSGSHWAVYSDNPRVFWSSLMEKAYAKLYSSYQALQGGWIGDALEDFTGGVTDRYEDIQKMKKSELWKMLEHNTWARFYMGAAVIKEFDDPKDEAAWTEKTGLANNHAYSLLMAKELKIQGKNYKLLRIRNPWGNRYEFKGKFNEKTGELWKKLDAATREEFPAGDDGEFWLDLEEFRKYFKMVDVLNLNPFGIEAKTFEELCDETDFTRILQDGDWTENCYGGLGKDKDDENVGDDAEENDAETQTRDGGSVAGAAPIPNKIVEKGEIDASSITASVGRGGAARADLPIGVPRHPVPAFALLSLVLWIFSYLRKLFTFLFYEEEADVGEKKKAHEDEESESDDDDEESEADKDNKKEDPDEPVAEPTEADYNTICLNPQIKFTVPEVALDGDGKSRVVLVLFQRYRRNLQKVGGKEEKIGMAIAKMDNNYPVKGSDIFNGTTWFKNFEGGDYRTHTVRVSLTPGQYVVIPYNKAKVLADFTVIVFTKK